MASVVSPNAVAFEARSEMRARSNTRNALAQYYWACRPLHTARQRPVIATYADRQFEPRVPGLRYDPSRTVPSCSPAASARFIEACKFFQAR